MQKYKTILVIFEFIILFILLPLLFYFELINIPKIPSLVISTLYCVIVLLKDSSFDRKKLWHPDDDYKYLKKIVLRFVPVSVLLLILTLVISPATLFIFPREMPVIWIVVMVFYPIVSAYPQELVYRTFFFHRYQFFLKSETWIIFSSAILFSFLHIIFDNALAVVLSLGGGYLFSITYSETKSLFLTSVEHALYGCFIFSIGLGNYFYEGF